LLLDYQIQKREQIIKLTGNHSTYKIHVHRSCPDQLADNQLTDSQKIVITTITATLAEEALAEEVVSKA